MEQPTISVRPPQAEQANTRRFVGFVLVAFLHVFVIYAFMSGLAAHLVEKIPQQIKVQIVQEVVQSPKPPPPPPPKLDQPPPPYVPPPEITVETPTPPTNSITVQSKISGPAQQVDTALVPTAPLGNTHNCDSYYPPISQRLSEVGKVLVRYSVSPEGLIGNVSVAKTSGSVRLDTAAINCVRERWRNAPASQGGRAVASTSEAYVAFEMH